MFDRFTDRARKVMGLAYQEAKRFNHDYIGTEHILLGLVQEGSGVAATVLKRLGVDLKKLRSEVEKLVSTGTMVITMGQLPFTPRAKKVLELSLEEASSLGHPYIGTEHLLLALIRESEGIAAQALRDLKVKVADVREKVLEDLGAEPSEVSGEGAPADGATHSSLPTLVGPLFTPLAVVALGYAHRLAARRKVVVGPMHLLAGLLTLAEDRPKEPSVARSFGGLDLPRLAKRAVRDAEGIVGAAPVGGVTHSPETLRVLATAMTIAANAGRSTASQTDVLAALVKDPNAPTSLWLKEAGVDVERLRGN